MGIYMVDTKGNECFNSKISNFLYNFLSFSVR
jgi:hypothetical protein